VHHVENHGVEQIVTLRIAERSFKAAIPANVPLQIDQSATFDWNKDRMHAFDTQSGLSILS
jgi:multiple sugar transport system ATP-binding protein